MQIKNFKPAGNQILARLIIHTETKGGVHNLNPHVDGFAQVVSVGEGAERTKVGDFIMFGNSNILKFPFQDGDGEIIDCIMAAEFSIIAYYTPDKGEDRIFVPEEEAKTNLPSGIQLVSAGADLN